MGDNRSNSLSTPRFSLGFVPIDQVVGKAVWIIWPVEEHGRLLARATSCASS